MDNDIIWSTDYIGVSDWSVICEDCVIFLVMHAFLYISSK